jgi:hypothetical protein
VERGFRHLKDVLAMRPIYYGGMEVAHKSYQTIPLLR